MHGNSSVVVGCKMNGTDERERESYVVLGYNHYHMGHNQEGEVAWGSEGERERKSVCVCDGILEFM